MKLTLNTNDVLPKESAELRGKRLKRIRNLANLSRKELCKDNELNENTLKGWELGRYGGLTAKGAEKIVQRIKEEGVCCRFEWLLYEFGQGATVIADYAKMKEMKTLAETHNSLVIWTDEEEMIAKEFALFRSSYKHTLDIRVEDDGMLPLYRLGDYLAGVPVFGERINKLIEENCIVLTEEGEMLLRKIRRGNQENTFHLTCINTETTVNQPILYDVKLVAAAAVSWQRRKVSI